MAINRRGFLKVAGVGALGLAGLPATRLFGKEEPRGGRRLAMVIDLTKKVDDTERINTCHRMHNVPDLKNPNHEIKWIWNTSFKHAFPGLASNHMQVDLKDEKGALVLCNHCENPACVRVCPTQATFKRKQDGIVLMDFHRCIGCRFCMAACPYGARSFNWVDPRTASNLSAPGGTLPTFPTRMKGVVEKCNFCAERLAQDEKPYCVQKSIDAGDGRMFFGDLNDTNDEVNQIVRSTFTVRRKLHLGTEPSVFYIV